ncbi:hypothetical protein C3766_01630 [Heyndrickxia coagulans]|nr:hypothetical protein C3766_01630 [Heyndrickxia coagulans]
MELADKLGTNAELDPFSKLSGKSSQLFQVPACSQSRLGLFKCSHQPKQRVRLSLKQVKK